ncbi:class A sortase [Exiguobacterium sp. s150]|uniref:class A sortase n=1 Tax=Exiguobacterium sp. s150 TaxID=2751221 RepID=UPI001BE63053|nr:class A sortase [Exiguobacterium sp. s150]
MRRIRFGLGILFILVGLFFLSNAWWKDQVAVFNSQRVTEGLQLKQPKSGEFDFSAVAPLSWNDLVTVRNRFHELPTIGVISVPEIKLELPIMYGLEADNLAVGAGTMRPNQQMGLGNYALAGHYTQSPTSLFGPLHEIETGMSVYVTDLTHTYEYVVTSLETVPPSRVDVLDETIDPTITLVTCTFDATERLIVKGRLAQTTPYAP